MTINEARVNFIKDYEQALIRYKRLSEENPDSLFYKGLIKNTQEYIDELKEKVATDS